MLTTHILTQNDYPAHLPMVLFFVGWTFFFWCTQNHVYIFYYIYTYDFISVYTKSILALQSLNSIRCWCDQSKADGRKIFIFRTWLIEKYKSFGFKPSQTQFHFLHGLSFLRFIFVCVDTKPTAPSPSPLPCFFQIFPFLLSFYLWAFVRLGGRTEDQNTNTKKIEEMLWTEKKFFSMVMFCAGTMRWSDNL